MKMALIITEHRDAITFGIACFIAACAYGIGYFTKRDKLENELEIEVELNVKLLKEKNRLDEYSNYIAGLLTAHRDLCPIFHPELDAATSSAIPAVESERDGSGDVANCARAHFPSDGGNT